MTINPEVYEILKKYSIDKDWGITTLLSVYHGLGLSFIPTEIRRSVNLTKIFEVSQVEGKPHITWNVPLYEGQVIENNEVDPFDWVKEWRERFKAINPERAGTLSECIKRMKWFFATYPQYRKEDVIKATDHYLKQVQSINYLKKSYKFIYEGAGSNKVSLLLEQCELLEELSKSDKNKMNYKGLL